MHPNHPSDFSRRAPRAALAGLLIAALTVPASAAERTWSNSYTLADGATFSLSNINGDAVIRGVRGNQVTVTATLSAPTEADLDALDISVDKSTRRLSVETDYSKKRGRWGNSGSVSYEVEVPRNIRLDELELVNGSLQLENLSGDIEASLVNGSLDARGLGGSVELETVNGRLEVMFDSVDDNQRIELESVNGSIELILPSDVGARIEATTVHGKIRNDFGLKVDKGEYVGSDMQGTIGGGDARIQLETVNGSIEVLRQ